MVEYSYDGYLIFTPFRTEIQGSLSDLEDSEVESQLAKRLPQYSDGSPHEPGEGFKRVSFRELLEEEDLYQQYPNLESIAHLRHIRESYQTARAFDDGESKQVQLRSTDSTDVFWSYPQFVFLRGPLSSKDRTLTRIRSLLIDSLYVESIEFDTEFFTWLLYKHESDDSLDFASLRSIHDATLSGAADAYGSLNEVSGSVDVLSSLPVLSGILQGKQVTRIEGAFNYEGKVLQVEVAQDTVSVKASKGSMTNMTSVERMSASISFLIDLCQMYSNWESMPPTQRYPPTEFFENIHEKALRQGIDIQYIPEEVLRKYEVMRGESE